MSAFWLRLFGVLCLLGAGVYLLYLFTPESEPRTGPVEGDRPESRLRARFLEWLERLGSGAREALGQSAPVVRGGLEQAGSWLKTVSAPSSKVHETRLVALAREASLREGYDAGHAERVADLAIRLGLALGFDEETLQQLRWAAWLHDVAPTGLDEALNAPMALSPRDRSRLQRHPLLCQMAVEDLLPGSDAAWWVRMAHERSDGTGYPDGSFNADLPLPARCLAIADTFEALVHDRPFRRALEPQDALLELQQVAGTQLDASLVKCFVEQVYPDWIR